MTKKQRRGLYDPSFERDSCGFGLIANIDDQPSHWVIETAITALKRLTHRGAISSDGSTGDGCGILLNFPKDFLKQEASKLNIKLNENFAVGTVFLNPNIKKTRIPGG